MLPFCAPARGERKSPPLRLPACCTALPSLSTKPDIVSQKQLTDLTGTTRPGPTIPIRPARAYDGAAAVTVLRMLLGSYGHGAARNGWDRVGRRLRSTPATAESESAESESDSESDSAVL